MMVEENEKYRVHAADHSKDVVDMAQLENLIWVVTGGGGQEIIINYHLIIFAKLF